MTKFIEMVSHSHFTHLDLSGRILNLRHSVLTRVIPINSNEYENFSETSKAGYHSLNQNLI